MCRTTAMLCHLDRQRERKKLLDIQERRPSEANNANARTLLHLYFVICKGSASFWLSAEMVPSPLGTKTKYILNPEIDNNQSLLTKKDLKHRA